MTDIEILNVFLEVVLHVNWIADLLESVHCSVSEKFT